MDKVELRNYALTGNEKIDSEHKMFDTIIKKLESAIKHELNTNYIIGLLDELEKFAYFHFTSEENLMQLNKYPDFELHKNEHKRILSDFGQLYGFKGNKNANHELIVHSVKNWLFEHSRMSDKKFSSYLEENGDKSQDENLANKARV